MEEKEVKESKPKYHHGKYNNNKRIETLEDLCHLLRNKTNQLYGDDQLMITMVTRLIEGKDAVETATITLPAAVIIPLKLIQYQKQGYISPDRTKAQVKIEEDEYQQLSDTYNASKAVYDQAYSTAIEKIKTHEKDQTKHTPYKQSICAMICDLLPKELKQELQLLEGAVDSHNTDGFLTAFGFLSHDPKLLLSKVKAVLDKSAPTSGESNASRKEKWLNDMHHFQQFEREHTNSYVLRFNELMKRGESIFGTKEAIFLQYQSEPFLAKRLIEGLKDGTLLKIYDEESLRNGKDELWIKTIAEAKKLIEKKMQQVTYAKSIRVDYQQKSAFQAQQGGHGTGNKSNSSKSSRKENPSNKKDQDAKEASHYCGYCDGKGHYKSNCTKFREHADQGCIRQDWLNKSDSERRCTFCQIKGHQKEACKIKAAGKDRGDYNSKKTYKKEAAAIATKSKEQEADEDTGSKHYGFMMLVDEHDSEERDQSTHITNIASFSIEENTGNVVATSTNGSITESKLNNWTDKIEINTNKVVEIAKEQAISVEAPKDVDDEVTYENTEASDDYKPIIKYDEHQVTVLLIPDNTTEEHVYIERDRKVVESKDLIILDTGATVSIFCNPLLVSDIIDVAPIYVTGIAPQKVKISKMGKCNAIYGINVYVDTNIQINIVSFAILDKLVRIERTQLGFSCGSIVWSLVDNLYIFSLACDCAQLKRDVFMLTNVEKRAELEQRALTRKERFLNNIERFLERMGISPTMLKQIIKHQTIKGLAFTESDVDHLITKYGSSLAYQSSRAKHQKQNVKLQLYDEIPEKVITLFCDLFKIYKRWFCLVVCSHIKAYHCIPISGRGEIELNTAIVTILRVIRNQGWNSRVLYIDGEKALNVTNSLENLEGLRVIKMPGTHVGEAEVGVRIIKERVWYRHGLLHFNLVLSLVDHIVNCMTRMINASPKEIDGRIISSREFITGHAVHADQMQFSFGDLVGAYVGGTEERRYKPALVLYPTFEADNSYILLDITPNKKGEIGRVNIIKTGSVCKIEWSAELKYAVESMGHMVDKSELTEELEELDPEAVENISNIAMQESLVDLVLEEKVKCRDVFVGDKTTDKMSFDQALKLYPHLVKDAVESELHGFLETDAIEPIDHFVSDPIRSFGFFKVKRDAVTGDVLKLKYRLVINGKVKRLSGFYETFDRDFAGYTPSWANTAAYMSINAAKGKHFMLMDVKQAYLQTENNLGHHMVLSKQETAVLIKLKPEWARYVRKNGEILVKVKKSIYGLKESGRLWYEEFVKRATEYPGVKVNPVDVCFLGNGSLGMCVYVDDNLVCGTLDELQGFRTHMEKYFGDMVCSKVDDFAYLGMHVTIIGGKVELKATAYCNKLVAENSSLITKEYNTPCNKNLFIETEPETELSQTLKEKLKHH